jgi:4-amino-4-deoxy-L-arabinose transferase-like glycosyltransferase
MQRKTSLALTAIVALALLVRIAAMIYFRAYDISPEADHWAFGFETGRIARSLALGQGFSSPLIEPSGLTGQVQPGYPLILAGIFKLFGVYTAASAVAVYVFNSLCAALTCLGIYRLGKHVFDAKVGLAAAAIFALYPPSIWHAVNTIWDVSLLVLMLVALVNCLYALPPSPSLKRIGGLGLFMGLIALVNPVPVLFYPAIAFIVWRRARRPDSSGFGEVALLTGCCLLVYLPWIARNAVVLGVTAPRTVAGVNLRVGNNEGAWRMGTGTGNYAIYPTNSKEEGRLFYRMGEVEYDRYCSRLAMDFMRRNPGKFAGLTLMRIRTWWLGQGDDWNAHFKLEFRLSALKRSVYLVPLPFFLIGSILAWRKNKPAGIVFALLLIYPLPYYFFFVSHRYRFPMEPFMLVLAVYGAMWLAALLRRRELRAVRTGGVAVQDRA